MPVQARYDSIADWYDDFAAAGAQSARSHLVDLLGPGTGGCLDLACGTGLNFAAIRQSGRVPVGVDLSAGQLRIAGQRERALVRGDAARLPFGDATFPAATAVWLSTDVEDFGAVLRECARVLVPGSPLAYYGVHPCFNGPCIERTEDGRRIVHPTYRDAGWHQASPWWGTAGVRSRVGMRHVPLADFLNAFVQAGLEIRRVLEPDPEPVPFVLALQARRTLC
jgi:ubiquinone/menaquinone biosynthesis C-methylase UbiE